MGILPSINIVSSPAQGRRLTLSLSPYFKHSQYQMPKTSSGHFLKSPEFLLLFLRFSKIELFPDLQICQVRNPPSPPPKGSYIGSQALEPLVGVLYTIRKVDDFPIKLQRILGLRGWATERSSFTLNSMLMLPGTRLGNSKVLPSRQQTTDLI